MEMSLVVVVVVVMRGLRHHQRPLRRRGQVLRRTHPLKRALMTNPLSIYQISKHSFSSVTRQTTRSHGSYSGS